MKDPEMKRKSYILILWSLIAATRGFSMPIATDLESQVRQEYGEWS